MQCFSSLWGWFSGHHPKGIGPPRHRQHVVHQSGLLALGNALAEEVGGGPKRPLLQRTVLPTGQGGHTAAGSSFKTLSRSLFAVSVFLLSPSRRPFPTWSWATRSPSRYSPTSNSSSPCVIQPGPRLDHRRSVAPLPLPTAAPPKTISNSNLKEIILTIPMFWSIRCTSF